VDPAKIMQSEQIPPNCSLKPSPFGSSRKPEGLFALDPSKVYGPHLMICLTAPELSCGSTFLVETGALALYPISPPSAPRKPPTSFSR
jgi:hypothetical protein